MGYIRKHAGRTLRIANGYGAWIEQCRRLVACILCLSIWFILSLYSTAALYSSCCSSVLWHCNDGPHLRLCVCERQCCFVSYRLVQLTIDLLSSWVLCFKTAGCLFKSKVWQLALTLLSTLLLHTHTHTCIHTHSILPFLSLFTQPLILILLHLYDTVNLVNVNLRTSMLLTMNQFYFHKNNIIFTLN